MIRSPLLQQGEILTDNAQLMGLQRPGVSGHPVYRILNFSGDRHQFEESVWNGDFLLSSSCFEPWVQSEKFMSNKESPSTREEMGKPFITTNW